MTKRRFIRRIFLITLYCLIIFSGIKHLTVPKIIVRQPPETFWHIQSIDTMKYSRDASRDSTIMTQVPMMVTEIAKLHANYIAIDTPYDDEFYSVLKTWVTEARKHNLHVWFRGNFSSWEGWFDYPKFDDPSQHHQLTYAFITKHPELFRPQDIFTPIPEPENGGLGDPRKGETTPQAFNAFLVASYQNCKNAFQDIHTNVLCGYFSVNGDIAKQILTKETVRQIGNVVVIDHYVSSPDEMEKDITYLHTKLGGKIILGEFGAPIIDINGDMDETQQADFIGSIFTILKQHNDSIGGINYWVERGGSTSLYLDDGTPKLASHVINAYYHPVHVAGVIKNAFNKPVSTASIYSQGGDFLGRTDRDGTYAISFVPTSQTIETLTIKAPNYQNESISFTPEQNKTIVQNIQITSTDSTMVTDIQALIMQLLGI